MTVNELAKLYCVDATTFELPDTRPSWFTFGIDKLIQKHATEKRFLQMPSFWGAKAIGVFSDYSGDSPKAKAHTYSFLFADYGALETFDQKVKEIRQKCGILLNREIKFEQLQSGDMQRALPLILRAADEIPGLLFSLVVDKRVSSVIGIGKDTDTTLKTQLAGFGFRSWDGKGQAERLARVLHSVSYWLGLLGRKNMKTFWMTDNDSILGKPDEKGEFKEFEEAYGRTLSLFNSPEFEIIGTAKSFAVNGNQPYPHELVSVADLVAGGLSAYFTDREGGSRHAKKHQQIGEILTFLGHQAVFLKKFTMAVMPSPSPEAEPSCGLVSLTGTSCSTEGYTSVEFA
ncbi:MAG: hypothetical protein JNM40_21575 [Myxococcales bacterium]|jgi:hypothetical protein|nr:hypothetical protein [Myxococcales bacterium]